MQQKRVTGFVVGSDTKDDKVVHKVRVRDDASKFNGKKCEVVSIHDNIPLVQGLDVSFLVATAQERGRVVLKAVDVQLYATTEARSTVEQDTFPTETINVAVTEYHGTESVFVTEIETEEEMREYILEQSGGDESLVAFLVFSGADVNSQDVEKQAGFRIVESLTHHPTTVDVLDSLLTSVFRLGRRSS